MGPLPDLASPGSATANAYIHIQTHIHIRVDIWPWFPFLTVFRTQCVWYIQRNVRSTVLLELNSSVVPYLLTTSALAYSLFNLSDSVSKLFQHSVPLHTPSINYNHKHINTWIQYNTIQYNTIHVYEHILEPKDNSQFIYPQILAWKYLLICFTTLSTSIIYYLLMLAFLLFCLIVFSIKWV